MFKFIFYFFGIIAILYEYWSVSNYPKLAAFKDKISEAKKNKVNMKLTQSQSILAVLHLLYFFWAIVGLFTSQWEVFLLIFGLSMLNHWIKGEIWNLIDAILTVALIMFAILNTYHWHINLFREVIKFYVGE
jgi:hypothetical protein